MFGARVRELPPIREAVAAYVSKAAEEMRAQGSLAGALQVAIRTGMHNPDQPRYANCINCPLPYPTDDTRVLAAAAAWPTIRPCAEAQRLRSARAGVRAGGRSTRLARPATAR